MALKDWKDVGFQLRQGFDEYDRSQASTAFWGKLVMTIFFSILGIGIAFVVLQTIFNWAVKFAGPLVGIVLFGYIALKVFSSFTKKR